MRVQYTNALIPVLVLMLVSLPSLAGVYQWKDSSGEIHYSDQVPPENATRGHSKLNEFGQTVEKISAQRSPAQIQLDNELAAIAAEKHRQSQLQSSKDRALIVTFSDVAQLDKLRDERIRLLDATIRLTKNKTNKIELLLEEAENRKIQYVSKNRTPPKQLGINILEYERQLANHYNQNALNIQRKQKIISKFAADRVRFLELQARN